MYQIKKVLNNNSLLVHDEKGNAMILMEKGIGFGKKADTYMHENNTAQRYCLAKSNERGATLDMIEEVDPIFIEIAAKIVGLAKQVFHEVDVNILLPLADHIAFAIERMKQGMVLSNPFTNEIRLLYQPEFDVAMHGKDIIQQRLGYTISEDEVGYITLHIHAALSEVNISQSIKAASVLKESIEQIGNDFGIKINLHSMSYARLMNHMKYLLLRLQKEEALKVDVSDFVKDTFPYAYASAQALCLKLSEIFHHPIDDIEVGYLALHIERIRTSERE